MSLWDKKGVAKQIEALWDSPDEEALRERIAAWVDTLRRNSSGPARAKLLDVGCGSARMGPHLKGWRYFGIDGSEELLKFAAERMPRAVLVHQDLRLPLPFSNEEFDTVLCVNVLRHLSMYGSIVREMARVARRSLLIVDSFQAADEDQFGESQVAGQTFPDNQWSLPRFLACVHRERPGWLTLTDSFGHLAGVSLVRP